MTCPPHIAEYFLLAREVGRVAASDASAELKYTLIFSERLSQRLSALIPLDYYDPDASHEEDIFAYTEALAARCAELRKIYPEET